MAVCVSGVHLSRDGGARPPAEYVLVEQASGGPGAEMCAGCTADRLLSMARNASMCRLYAIDLAEV